MFKNHRNDLLDTLMNLNGFELESVASRIGLDNLQGTPLQVAGQLIKFVEVKGRYDDFLAALSAIRPDIDLSNLPRSEEVLTQSPHHLDAAVEQVSVEVGSADLDKSILQQDKLTQLRRMLVNRFSEGELSDFSFDLGVDYDLLPGERKTDKARELVSYIERRNRIPELLRVGKEIRPDIPWDTLSQVTPDRLSERNSEGPSFTQEQPSISFDRSVAFTNRVEEIQFITNSNSPAYLVIDAPAGYGKTALLREIPRRLSGRSQWICAYVKVNEKDTIFDFALRLIEKLKLSCDLSASQNAASLGLRIAAGIRREFLLNRQRSVIFIIDSESRPDSKFVADLLNGFIPSVYKSLHTLTSFSKAKNRFRLLLAGRYLAGDRTIRNAPLPITSLRLEPFDFKVIRDTARLYLPDQEERAVRHVAAHINFLTGGHPGCASEALKLYRELMLPPDEFAKAFKESYWEDTVYQVTQEINCRANGLMKELSYFRYLDYRVLRTLIADDILTSVIEDAPDISEFDLADRLTRTYLMSWHGRLLADDMIRRMLVLGKAYELQGSDFFKEQCRYAQSIYEQHLRNPHIQMPERWAIEYMFQDLQAHTLDIHDNSNRRRIRCEFFGSVVPTALELLYRSRDFKAERNVLLEALDADWEFQFVVNYYLREELFALEPFKRLHSMIKQSSP